MRSNYDDIMNDGNNAALQQYLSLHACHPPWGRPRPSTIGVCSLVSGTHILPLNPRLALCEPRASPRLPMPAKSRIPG